MLSQEGDPAYIRPLANKEQLKLVNILVSMMFVVKNARHTLHIIKYSTLIHMFKIFYVQMKRKLVFISKVIDIWRHQSVWGEPLPFHLET